MKHARYVPSAKTLGGQTSHVDRPWRNESGKKHPVTIASRVEEKDERRRGEKIRRDGEKVKEKEGKKSDIICERVCEERKRKTLY